MRHRNPQSGMFHPFIIFILLVVVIVGAFVTVSDKSISSKQPFFQQQEKASSSFEARVVKVYDGDTIKLSNGEKVRLIGIDTPEIHDNPKLARDTQKFGVDSESLKRMGLRSYEYTRGLLSGRDVRLEFDKQPRDRYGRLLAYVYLDDGTFVNESIIKDGYAYPMSVSPNTRHAKEFKALFEQARARRIGLWRD